MWAPAGRTEGHRSRNPALSLTLAAAFFDDPSSVGGSRRTPDARNPAGFFRLVAEVNLSHDELYGRKMSRRVRSGSRRDGNPPRTRWPSWVPAIAEATAEYAERLLQALDLMSEVRPQRAALYLFFMATRRVQSRGMVPACSEPFSTAATATGHRVSGAPARAARTSISGTALS